MNQPISISIPEGEGNGDGGRKKEKNRYRSETWFFFLQSNNNIKHFFLHTFSTWCSNHLLIPEYKILYILEIKNSTPKAEKNLLKLKTLQLQWQEQIYRPTI